MTFSGNFMPKRFGFGKPQKSKIKTYSQKVKLPPDGPKRKRPK